jgi:hypothetical protein
MQIYISSIASINPTFFDLSENWHSESFSQKRNYRVTNFSVFHDFCIILF